MKSGRRLLIETTNYAAVRTARYLYAEHDSGERELYDLDSDPAELQNVADAPEYADAQAALAADLHTLRFCSGFTCRRKPQLELKLHYTRRFTRRGHPNSPLCAEQPVMARVTGDDESQLRVGQLPRRRRLRAGGGRPVPRPAAGRGDELPPRQRRARRR